MLSNYEKKSCSKKQILLVNLPSLFPNSLIFLCRGIAYRINDTYNLLYIKRCSSLRVFSLLVYCFRKPILSHYPILLMRLSLHQLRLLRLSYSPEMALYLHSSPSLLRGRCATFVMYCCTMFLALFLPESAAAESVGYEALMLEYVFSADETAPFLSSLFPFSRQEWQAIMQYPSEYWQNGFGNNNFLLIQDSTRRVRPQPVSTRTTTPTLGTSIGTSIGTSATRTSSTTLTLSTQATAYSSTSFVSAATSSGITIPLVSEPFVDVSRYADSLGVRRSSSFGSKNGRGIEGIPYNSSQGYSFDATVEEIVRNNTPTQTLPNRTTPSKNPAKSDVVPLNIRLRESIMGTPSRMGGQVYSLDEYLSARNEYLRLGLQDSIMHHYEFRKPLQSELMSILTQSSNMSIPFPNNPLTTIFGKPEIRLNANIEFNIRLGLGYNAANLGVNSATGQGQFFPIFNQSVQSNVTASLGDKFSINLDNNTQRQFEFDNLLRFAYDGEPDEIFRRIEVGNVSLNSPSTFISGSQALFGARMDLQFGPVFLKLLYAQKRGQRKVTSVKAGAVRQPISLRAYDYAPNHFFINTRHRGIWQQYAKTAPELPNPGSGRTNNGIPIFGGVDSVSIMRVKEIEVWESTTDLRAQESAECVALADIDSLKGANEVYPRERYADAQTQVGVVERGRFVRLQPDRYEFDPNLGRLTIFNLRQNLTYGIAYRLENGSPTDDDDLVYGTFSRNLSFTDSSRRVGNTTNASVQVGDSLVRLQLVYRANMQPAFKSLWKRQMQNIYSIGAQQVKIASTKIDIVYFDPKTNDSLQTLPAGYGLPGVKIPTILGVDRVNNNGNGDPDGVIDLHLPFIFNQTRGDLIFPSLEPFREGLRDYFKSKGTDASKADSLVYSMVYDTTREAAKTDIARDRFVISGEVSGSSGNRIQIPNAFNLAPGSVKVKLNNNVLEEYKDYRVEYFTGMVEMTNPEAMALGANLEIEYEQNDVFTIANKQMMGLRLDLDTKPLLRSRDITADLGVTVMNYQQQIITERIRIGEEPMNNTMVGADGKFTWNADWLTKALDWLPFYDTKAPSSITASGEAAWMLPIPNNRKSDVESDKGQPAVYIDDFEAAQRTYSIGLQPSQWRHASPPSQDPKNGAIFPTNWDAQTTSFSRGRVYWYQFPQNRVPQEIVYPNKSVIRGGISANSNIPTLEINFNPDYRGIYNRNPQYLDLITYTTSANVELLTAQLPSATNATSAYRRDSTSLFSSIPENRKNIWGGFMRLLSPFNTNFDNDNIEYLEIVMQRDPDAGFGVGMDPNTKMYIDIGQINEDVIPNGKLDTEDGILPGREIPNGMITSDEAAEDVGIDGLGNIFERGSSFTVNNPNFVTGATVNVFTSIFNPNSTSTIATFTVPPAVQRKADRDSSKILYSSRFIRNEEDPARDDFRYTKFNLPSSQFNTLQDTDFVYYNGYENSAGADAGKFPDTEILNSNNGQTLMRSDAYFRYEVNLDPLANNPQIFNYSTKDQNPNGFITYRIPIRKNYTKVGEPLFTNIQYVRVFWKGGKFSGRIANWQFVGSQWIRQPALLPNKQPDTRLQIGFVSTEENAGAPDFYTVPPGVQRQTQLTNPDPNQRILLNEQSLSLRSSFKDKNEEHIAARFFRPFDIFFYKRLKIFFYGKNDSSSTLIRSTAARDSNNRSSVQAFLRFGVDTANYYEYNVALREGWQEVDIPLSTLTAFKARPDVDSLLRQLKPATVTDPQNPEGQYIIRGAPTLTRVQYVAVGMRSGVTGNPNDIKKVQLWANEMRIVEPDVNINQGWAAVGNISAKLADLGTINATVNIMNPYFNRLEERFGNRNERQSFNLTSQFALEKFFPESWAGTSLPLSYTYTYSLDKPRFIPQNDVVSSTFATSEAGRVFSNKQDSLRRSSYQNYLASRSETEVVEQQLALTGVRFNVPVPFFLFTDITNQIVMNFAYTNREERSPVAAYRYNFNWRFQAQYQKNFAQVPIRPFGWTDSIPELSFLKDWTLYFLPNTFSLSFESNRSRQLEVLRSFVTQRTDTMTNLPLFRDVTVYRQTLFGLRSTTLNTLWLDSIASPDVRNFDASRQLQMSWKLADNGLLNPTIDWTVNTYSTMLGFEIDQKESERKEATRYYIGDSAVFQQIFPGIGNGLLNLGIETRHSQNIAFNLRPRLPAFLGGNRYIALTGRYNANYNWDRVFNSSVNGKTSPDSALNKVAKHETNLNFGVNLRLNDLAKLIPVDEPNANANFNPNTAPLQLLSPDQPVMLGNGAGAKDTSLAGKIWQGFLLGTKALLNWDQANFNVIRRQSAINGGLLGNQFGGTGFMSGLGGALPGVFNSLLNRSVNLQDFGPSMEYQLGLVAEPHQYLQFNAPSAGQTKPLFSSEGGLRPANAFVSDVLRQNTSMEIRLQREVWLGATLELSTGTLTDFTRNQTQSTDALGVPTPRNRIDLYKYERTIVSFADLSRIGALYNQYTNNIPATDTGSIRRLKQLDALNNAFFDGLDLFSVPPSGTEDSTTRALRTARKTSFFPAVNWALRWNGLEQFAPLKGIIRSGTLEHKYVSRYSSTERLLQDNNRTFDTQTLLVSFEPILAITATFEDKFVEGMMSGSLRLDSKTQLGYQASNPTQITRADEFNFSLQGTYTRRGFKLPKIPGLELFKMVGSEINIQNDIEFALQASWRRQSTRSLDIGRGEAFNANGRTIDGTNKILIEPSARYTFSKQVTVRAFIGFEGNFNEGAQTPGSWSLQGGIDIRLALTGGRNF